MLFGTGFYFSELPYVSLVYGSALLLCKENSNQILILVYNFLYSIIKNIFLSYTLDLYHLVVSPRFWLVPMKNIFLMDLHLQKYQIILTAELDNPIFTEIFKTYIFIVIASLILGNLVVFNNKVLCEEILFQIYDSIGENLFWLLDAVNNLNMI